MSQLWRNEEQELGGFGGEKADPFLSRMQNDVAKRESQKQLNELKKTGELCSQCTLDRKCLIIFAMAVEGRRILKSLDPSLVNGITGKDREPEAPRSNGSGLSGITAPKVVVHSQNKLNDNKQWSSETWAKNSYLF